MIQRTGLTTRYRLKQWFSTVVPRQNGIALSLESFPIKFFTLGLMLIFLYLLIGP